LPNWTSDWDVALGSPLTSAANTCCALLGAAASAAGSAGPAGSAASTATRKDAKADSGGMPSRSWRALAGSSGADAQMSRLQRALEQSLLYSGELGIDLATGNSDALFRWFLAGLVFGARISETMAKNTYRRFAGHGLIRPERIMDAGRDFLIYPFMREGGYVRRRSSISRLTCSRRTHRFDLAHVR
jgi:hypothetical protein